MAKNICVLCGKTVPFLDRASLTIGGTRQTLCPGCYQIYQNASPADREALLEQALASPDLEDREAVQAALGGPLSEPNKDRPLQESNRKKPSGKACSACGGVLERVETGLTFFGWNLIGLANELEFHGVAVYACPQCGKVEFYRSDFQPEPSQPPDQPTTVTCPTCGTAHSRLLPCPNCGRQKERSETVSMPRDDSRKKKGSKPPWER